VTTSATPSTIYAALTKTILALTPRGGSKGRLHFMYAGGDFSFETLSDEKVDRCFSFPSDNGLGFNMERKSTGDGAGGQINDRLVLVIGHRQFAEEKDYRDRVAEDVSQLIDTLEKPANYPDGVWRIGKGKGVPKKMADRTITTITWEIEYYGLQP